MAYLRSKGIQSIVFIHDILLMGLTEDIMLEHTGMTVDVLEALGFLINYPQVTVNTCKECRLPGLQSELQHHVSELTGHEDLTHTARGLKPSVIGRGVCPTAGTANREALNSDPSRTTSATLLQESTAAKTPGPSKRNVLRFSQEAKPDLEWWSHNLPKWNKNHSRKPSPNLEIETDTSQ